MTTAARPTFEPARGGRGKNEGDLSALSKQYSSRDLPSHTKLKYRQEGQGTSEELRSRDFRRDIDDREKNVREKRDRNRESGSSSSSSSSKRQRLEQIPASNLDADDPIDDDDDDDSSDDEDDAAELMAELQKIKKERANEKVRLDVERKAEEERIRTENILKGNPLLNKDKDKGGNFNVKRRWDDDVVFKNCAKGEEKKSAFINDTLRSEFHKKFMEKYIK
ncbi:protein CWC15 homolog [Mytilus californianus]|uniref:protein CWC15 homolog n=1 Tax=Mytilus californianus TaxID=6549 RepID=UPI002247D963|nr:protein CWC15 homolog [Mytilus californianus]XP_052103930.1 protein CWC15 homolog [Mytilus californianus]